MRRFASAACQAVALGLLAVLIAPDLGCLIVVVLGYLSGWLECADWMDRLGAELSQVRREADAARAALRRVEAERDAAREACATMEHDILADLSHRRHSGEVIRA